MIWPRVIGQQRVKQTLLSAIRSGRMPHAYLFHGGEGVGKDAVAIELARVLHCERNREEACGECDSCLKVASMQHPDVRLVVALPVGKGEKSDDAPLAKLTEPEIKIVQEEYRAKGENPYHRIAIPRANIIKINSIREVRRESSMSTFNHRKRIFIISQADAMGDEASNTLLKTLEEPSGDTMLILTTAHKDALLPTILSRCQNIRFDTLSEDEIRTALIDRNKIEKERAALVARLANGSYTRAEDLLGDDLEGERQEVVNFIRHALSTSATSLSEDVDRVFDRKDRDLINQFLVLMLMWFRDALVLSNGGSIINLDQQEDLKRFVARFPSADLVAVLADVERAISLLARNVYIKLVLIDLAFRLKTHILHPGNA